MILVKLPTAMESLIEPEQFSSVPKVLSSDMFGIGLSKHGDLQTKYLNQKYKSDRTYLQMYDMKSLHLH